MYQAPFLLLPILWVFTLSAFGQNGIAVSGRVQDEATGEPLAFATVAFTVSGAGITTDEEGRFSLSSPLAEDTLWCSYLGYDSYRRVWQEGEYTDQVISLTAEAYSLVSVTVEAERGRYKRKGNPALELIRKVIARKDENRLSGQRQYQFERYEKVQTDVLGLGKKVVERRVLDKFPFLRDYIDTTATGETQLPFFLQEVYATHYYQRDPMRKRQVRKAITETSFDEYTSEEAMANLLNRLYQEIDIYENSIILFDQEFISPLAQIAPTFYRFYITDTLIFKDQEAYALEFMPVNKANLGFTGHLFIAADSSYRVLGADMGVLPTINLNFVENLQLRQEFALAGDSVWINSLDEISMDYYLVPQMPGLKGKKTTINRNFQFDPLPGEVFDGPGQLITLPDAGDRDSTWWANQRPVQLEPKEAAIYQMVDSLVRVPAFTTITTVVKLLSTGYYTLGPVDIGSVFSFISGNQIEGMRLKAGGRTNDRFHPNWRLAGYLAYGTKDGRFKYSGSLGYAFDKVFSPVPRKYLGFTYERDNRFPGQFLQFLSQDNLFLSWQLGPTDKMLGYEFFRLDYHHEFSPYFGFDLHIERRGQVARGDWSFMYYNEAEDRQEEIKEIPTTSAGLTLFWSPGARWWEGQYSRYRIPNKHPIMHLGIQGAVKGLLGGDYDYLHLSVGFRKRFYMGPLGFSTLDMQAGKIWGKGIPYVLLHIGGANQTVAFHPRAFNMMTFLEFVSDQYVSLHFNHIFYGVLFNRIPLIKKLKLREVVGFKMYYGSLTGANNPNERRELIQFEQNEDGLPETYTPDQAPYMEFSVGISNIFRFFEVQYVQRLNYLDHPDMFTLFGKKGAGIRVNLNLTF